MWHWFRKRRAPEKKQVPASLTGFSSVGARKSASQIRTILGLPIEISLQEPAAHAVFLHALSVTPLDAAVLASELPSDVHCLLVAVAATQKKDAAFVGSAMLLRGYRQIEGAEDPTSQVYVMWGFWGA